MVSTPENEAQRGYVACPGHTAAGFERPSFDYMHSLRGRGRYILDGKTNERKICTV